MKRTLNEHSTLAIITAATLLGDLFWGALHLFASGSSSFLGIQTDFWNTASALSSALTTGTILAAGFIARRELTELSDTRHFEVPGCLFDEHNSDTNADTRRRIYVDLPPFPEENIAGLPPDTQTAVKHVLNSLDRVAFLTQSGWIPEKDIMPWMNPMVVEA